MIKAAALFLLAATTTAQQSAWGQCGGTDWTGATTCVSGYYCSFENDYFSQCIPGTASSTTATITTATIATTTTAAATTAVTAAPSGLAYANGTRFSIDGVTEYYAGTNVYWLGMNTNKADTDKVMSDMASAGLKIIRVTGFYDVTSCNDDDTAIWFQCFQNGSEPTINTGANGLQLLDYAVEAAETYGTKLILNFVNNWDDYGGMQVYLDYYGGSTHEDWFTMPEIQAQYQTYIAAVMSRYWNSSSVLAWELCNEPRCEGCDVSIIYDWAKNTSEYIKSIDPYHMVTLGDEGFNPSAGDGSYPYTTGEGVSWIENLNITTLDFATFHNYPAGYGQSETGSWPADWIISHASACVAANKPCMMEEYGSTDNITAEALWGTIALNTDGIAADLFWDAGDTLSWGTSYDDGYTIYPNTSDWTVVVTDHMAEVDAANT